MLGVVERPPLVGEGAGRGRQQHPAAHLHRQLAATAAHDRAVDADPRAEGDGLELLVAGRAGAVVGRGEGHHLDAALPGRVRPGGIIVVRSGHPGVGRPHQGQEQEPLRVAPQRDATGQPDVELLAVGLLPRLEGVGPGGLDRLGGVGRLEAVGDVPPVVVRERVHGYWFLAKMRRRPCSVSQGSMSSIDLVYGAISEASPPVARMVASLPTSSTMRSTMPSTWPAKP